MRKHILVATVAGLCLSLAACQQKPESDNANGNTSENTVTVPVEQQPASTAMPSTNAMEPAPAAPDASMPMPSNDSPPATEPLPAPESVPADTAPPAMDNSPAPMDNSGQPASPMSGVPAPSDTPAPMPSDTTPVQ